VTGWETDRFGSMTRTLGRARWMTLSVWLEGIDRLQPGEPKYNASALNVRLKNRFHTREEAMAATERVAVKLLAEATGNLTKEPDHD
jgi:hypothetical protein